MILESENRSFLVVLEEEYGYRHWFWYPDMTQVELEVWWKNLSSVEPYFMTPEPLPGRLDLVEDLDEWMEVDRSKKHYYAHTHCDDDSILITPGGEKIYHEGYDGKKI